MLQIYMWLFKFLANFCALFVRFLHSCVVLCAFWLKLDKVAQTLKIRLQIFEIPNNHC